MNGCNVKLPDLKPDCTYVNDGTKIQSTPIVWSGKKFSKELKVSKVIYNYQSKTDQQIKETVQLEIDNVIMQYPDYRFKDSQSHFNKTGGIDLLLNFELNKL